MSNSTAIAEILARLGHKFDLSERAEEKLVVAHQTNACIQPSPCPADTFFRCLDRTRLFCCRNHTQIANPAIPCSPRLFPSSLSCPLPSSTLRFPRSTAVILYTASVFAVLGLPRSPCCRCTPRRRRRRRCHVPRSPPDAAGWAVRPPRLNVQPGRAPSEIPGGGRVHLSATYRPWFSAPRLKSDRL